MPTVPPTYVSVNPLDPVSLSDRDLLGAADELDVVCGPTPDPDTDDVVLVNVEGANAPVSQVGT